jgi:hypothetical protein
MAMKKTGPAKSDKKKKTGVFSSGDKAVILTLLNDFTDEEIAAKMNRNPAQILKFRRQASIYKAHTQNADSIELLHGKHFWKTLQNQLLKDEIRFFEEEWASYSAQFPELVHTDESMISDAIMLTIQINRLLSAQKKDQDQYDYTYNLLELESKKPEEDRDNELIHEYREIVSGLRASLNKVISQLKDLQNLKDNKYVSLKATRDQRFKRIEESKKNVFELMKFLSERDQRIKDNRMLSLVKDSTKKIKEQWMEPIEFADGSTDVILLSEETIEHHKKRNEDEQERLIKERQP